MAHLGRIFSNVVQQLKPRFSHLTSNFHSLESEKTALAKPGGLFTLAVRYKIRNYWPRPCERKRLKKHGWQTRISCRGGQQILMRRILKGRYILSH